MFREKFTTNLDSELIKLLKIHAIVNGKNANEIIEIALSLYLKNNKEESEKKWGLSYCAASTTFLITL